MGKVKRVVEEMIGMKFNMLTILGEPSVEGRFHKKVKCICDCGVIKDFELGNLARGRIKSCSCKQYNDMRMNNKTHGMSGGWKGKYKNRFYSVYNNIVNRVKRPIGRSSCYEGVKCEWNSFENFMNDMYESYLNHVEEYGEVQTTIDRIDPYGDYSKENCRWATIKEQSFNKKESIYVQYNGKEYTAKDLSILLGINYRTFIWRYHRYRKGLLNYDDMIKVI